MPLRIRDGVTVTAMRDPREWNSTCIRTATVVLLPLTLRVDTRRRDLY